jgi:GH15 family glucan-1,4-alpha-glucosidase
VASRIEDYALIGDLQTCALIGRNGSIDWLCAPRFDSPACFAALLGTRDSGRWQIAPAGHVRSVNRRYRDDTLILETDFECDGGRVRIVDFMPVRSEAVDLVRIVEGLEGKVSMRMDLVIRFDYGSIVPWLRSIEGGVHAIAGPDTLYCLSEVPMRSEGMATVAEFEVERGRTIAFDMIWAKTYGPDVSPEDPHHRLAATEKYWKDWSARSTYDGPWRAAVMRSLITLKALTYSPTGGLVAAPTSSLPERIGGIRNWDYRYCWLRDATFSLYALHVGGYTEEALAWREWLVNSVAGKPANLQIVYGVAGERRLTEIDLPWLPGYENSNPVRIGNAAHLQFQLDVYGEVVDALHLTRRLGLPPSEDAWRVQCAVMKFLEEAWKRPDGGIWEVRGDPRHFTHSKVMAWVAFDRAIDAVENYGMEGPVGEWRHTREAIRADVLRRGFDSDLNSFVRSYDSRAVDASLLMLPLLGFVKANDPRMTGTVDRIRGDLQVHGLLARYRTGPEQDGLEAGEGAFLICSFWLADVLALQQRHDEAIELFEHLLSLRNDVGLLAEEYDPRARRQLGNFPQAYSHVGLINTARNLQRHGGPAEDRKAGGSESPAPESSTLRSAMSS